MKVFISWSGERSQALGKVLHEKLPYILQYLDPWLSHSDIDAGERWSTKVAKELEACTFGITCLTAENVSSPWILFEAGSLAKSMEDGRVVPLLLDLSTTDLSGPLAQFQAKKCDRAGIYELLLAINKLAPNPLPDTRLQPIFETLWPDLERAILELPKSVGTAKKSRPSHEVLEELVDSVRGLEARQRELGDDAPRRRRRRIHPGMIEELTHRLGREQSDPIGILIISSYFKDDVPWLYDLGVRAYTSIKEKGGTEALEAWETFMRSFDMMSRSPFMFEEFGLDKRAFVLMDEMRHLMRYIEPPPSLVVEKAHKAIKPTPAK